MAKLLQEFTDSEIKSESMRRDQIHNNLFGLSVIKADIRQLLSKVKRLRADESKYVKILEDLGYVFPAVQVNNIPTEFGGIPVLVNNDAPFGASASEDSSASKRLRIEKDN